MIDHLQIIECIAYVYVNKKLHMKLDAKSTKYILVGYRADYKAYHVWNPQINKVFYSRNVIFNETHIEIKDDNI